MLELLPIFFAGVGIFTLGLGALLGTLVKMRLVRFLAGHSVRVRWSTVLQVVAWEVFFLVFSILIVLYRVTSDPSAFQGHPAKFMGVLLGCSMILYCIFAVIPNMYLLSKITGEDKDKPEKFQRLDYAALLALPTPLFSFTFVILLYAAS